MERTPLKKHRTIRTNKGNGKERKVKAQGR
jgi:hypothetical protein